MDGTERRDKVLLDRLFELNEALLARLHQGFSDDLVGVHQKVANWQEVLFVARLGCGSTRLESRATACCSSSVKGRSMAWNS